MWKAILPSVIALVTFGLSLVSGEAVKRDGEAQPVLGLAQTAEPNDATSTPAGALRPPAASHVAPRPVDGRPLALVIGNAAYPDAGLPLSQPVNNARALTAALREQGFDVEVGEDLTRNGMQRAFQALQARIEPGSPVLIFFSGLAIEAGRTTYLIPVDAHIWNEADVRRAGVSIEPWIAAIMEKGAGPKLLVLDASRRNPFEPRFRGFSAGPGAIHAPDNTLVMSAAAPGKVVDDGEAELSPMVNELIAQIRAPRANAEDVFNRTRLAVARSSDREQIPWVFSSLVQEFYFAPADHEQRAEHSGR